MIQTERQALLSFLATANGNEIDELAIEITGVLAQRTDVELIVSYLQDNGIIFQSETIVSVGGESAVVRKWCSRKRPAPEEEEK